MRNLIQRHPVITLYILVGIGILFFLWLFTHGGNEADKAEIEKSRERVHQTEI